MTTPSKESPLLADGIADKFVEIRLTSDVLMMRQSSS
jgi:hypothetical protein